MSTAPTTLYTNMLWLYTSSTPNLLERDTGSERVAAGAEEVKSSGIYIGPNNVAITTVNFLHQLLDPINNENVLMEMSANGNVGFKQLYADEVISDSVAAAYGGPLYLYVNTFSVKGCPAHICFQNLSLREIRTLNDSNRNPYLIDLQMNHHVELNNCTLDAPLPQLQSEQYAADRHAEAGCIPCRRLRKVA